MSKFLNSKAALTTIFRSKHGYQKKVKTYTINKRFTIWVSQDIPAVDFNDAVEKGRKMGIEDFIDLPLATTHNDSEELPGFGVHENF